MTPKEVLDYAKEIAAARTFLIARPLHHPPHSIGGFRLLVMNPVRSRELIRRPVPRLLSAVLRLR
jgi:hypothetical protein